MNFGLIDKVIENSAREDPTRHKTLELEFTTPAPGMQIVKYHWIALPPLSFRLRPTWP